MKTKTQQTLKLATLLFLLATVMIACTKSMERPTQTKTVDTQQNDTKKDFQETNV